ncbi:hypothetical protein SAMN02745116_01844 [Pilibacter termitis]|uniref:Lipoprotein n=1 Tax=Pilibacter termitis TaxID=263852 RepID=A0A1T4PLI6_9ENTE|nr:hypothetical protein [Pilibacter termitis]SJZ92211.1 hypothetical protein SAMN02745116_01844 [Pilibacter termitis]
MSQKGKIKKVLLFAAVVGLTAVLGACGQKGKSSAGKEEIKTSVKKKETTSTSTSQEVKKEVENDKQEVTPVSTEKPKEEVVQRTKEMEDFIFLMKNAQAIYDKTYEMWNGVFEIGSQTVGIPEEKIAKTGYSQEEVEIFITTYHLYSSNLTNNKLGKKWLVENYGEREINGESLLNQLWNGDFAPLKAEVQTYFEQYKPVNPEESGGNTAELNRFYRVLQMSKEMEVKRVELMGEVTNSGKQTAGISDEKVEKTGFTREQLEKVLTALQVYDDLRKNDVGKKWLSEQIEDLSISGEKLREKVLNGRISGRAEGMVKYL